MSRRLTLRNASGGGGILPPEYQQVEWIGKVNAYPYINTGVIPDNETGVLYDVALDPYLGDNNTDGVRAGAGERFTFGRFNRGIFIGWGSSYKSYQFDPSYLQRISVKCNYFNSRNASVDGVVFWNGLPVRASNNAPAYLLSTNQGSSRYWNATEERCYGAIYTQGNEIVRNFIPCYRKSDGVIGAYDTVFGTFYTNNGSDTFTKGADV